jgi:hypothetical protein
MSGRSAVIVPIGLPAGLMAIRDQADRMAARGVPPHMTILFPFAPADTLTPDVHVALAALAARTARFVARFDHVDRRDHAVWLVPADYVLGYWWWSVLPAWDASGCARESNGDPMHGAIVAACRG